jgi:hypothetical protein
MEEARGASDLENEVKGVDVHLEVDESNFNGHEEEVDMEECMMKIMEHL